MNSEERNKLGKIPKKDAFQAPEGYFETLASRIDEKIISQSEAKVVKPEAPAWRYVGVGIAASLLALLVFWFVWQREAVTPSAEDLLASVSSEDLVVYLDLEDVDFSDVLAIRPDVFSEESDTLNLLGPDIGDEDLELFYEEYGSTPEELK